MEEKPINGFPNYTITRCGRIFTYSYGYRKEKKTVLNKVGYYRVGLWNNSGKPTNFSVHRLIATHFIPNPEGKPCVNHKNGVKHDNRVENLEWCTYAENTQHAYETGLAEGLKGEDSCLSKYEETSIRDVCKLLEVGELTPTEIAEKVDIPINRVYAIIYKSSWAHVIEEYDIKRTKKKHLKKLDESVVRDICGMLNAGHTAKEISDECGFNYHTVWQIKSGRRYGSMSKIYLH